MQMLDEPLNEDEEGRESNLLDGKEIHNILYPKNHFLALDSKKNKKDVMRFDTKRGTFVMKKDEAKRDSDESPLKKFSSKFVEEFSIVKTFLM